MDCYSTPMVFSKKTVKYSYVNFLLRLPSILDITAIISLYLEKTSCPLLVIQRLNFLFKALLDARQRFFDARSISFNSYFHSSNSFFNDNHDASPLLFLEYAMQDSHQLEYSFNREYFVELTIKTIIFNYVKTEHVQRMIDIFRDTSNQLNEFESCYTPHYSDTKYCSCNDYAESGDCYCDENNGPPPSKLQCVEMPDISDCIILD